MAREFQVLLGISLGLSEEVLVLCGFFWGALLSLGGLPSAPTGGGGSRIPQSGWHTPKESGRLGWLAWLAGLAGSAWLTLCLFALFVLFAWLYWLVGLACSTMIPVIPGTS